MASVNTPESRQNMRDFINKHGKSSNSASSKGATITKGGGRTPNGSYSYSSVKSSDKGNDDALKEAKRAKEKAEKRARRSIGKRYDIIEGGLNDMLGWLPGQQQASTDKLTGQKDYSYGRVGRSLADTMGRFDNHQGDIMTGQKNTLRDLANDVRNSFQAGNIYLGAHGASDSSAAGMYSRGVQQAANRNRADVLNQVETNLNDLNIRREEAQSAAEQEYADIDNWFNNAMSDLETQFNDRRHEIEMAKVNAGADEQAALASLDTQLWQSAQQIYQDLLAQKDFYQKSVNEAIGASNASGSAFGDALDESSKEGYAPVRAEALNVTPDITSPSTGSDSDYYNINANPKAYSTKKLPDDALTGLGGLTPGMGYY